MALNTLERATTYVENTGLSTQYKILRSLLAIGRPVTSAEIADHMGIDRFKAGRRLPDLAKKKLVRRTRARKCRVTGRKAITWTTY